MGVHPSPNYIATAVVLVVPIAGGVRVIAISIPIRGIAILISIRIRVSVVVIVVIIRVAESEAAAPEIAIMESTTIGGSSIEQLRRQGRCESVAGNSGV